MKKLIIVLVIVAIVAFAVFHKKQSNNPANVYQASVRFDWIPSASFAGDIVGAQKFATTHNLHLTAEAGGPGVNPIQTVISGQDTFGYAAADDVVSAIDKGADLVIIGVPIYNSPAGFVSLKSKNITTPKDLEGKKVGILPYGNTTLIYEEMLKQNNIDRSKIKEITVSDDLKPFLSGIYDVHPVFVYDETVTLDQQHIQYNVIEPKNFNVNLIGTVYFTKRETLDKNPELVKAFVDTEADGWNYALKNPDEAIALLKSWAPEIDVNREKQVLLKGTPYFYGYHNQPLNSDTESWNYEVNELKILKVIQNNIELNKILQLQFINEYYNK